mgnify:CR=1 FL=1
MSVQDLQQLLLTYSLLLPRIISCFVVLPVLAKQTLGGGLVRNGVACSLALFAYPIVAGSLPPALDALDIALLIGKEVLLGLLIGFVATIPFWAMEATGFIIDNQRGAALASTFNPSLGSQTSPTGLLLTQTLITLFFSGGAFLALVGSLFRSYASWPVSSFFPQLGSQWVAFFYAQFSQMLMLCTVRRAAADRHVPRRVRPGAGQPLRPVAERVHPRHADQEPGGQPAAGALPGHPHGARLRCPAARRRPAAPAASRAGDAMSAEKTEQPTAKKLRDARRQGQVVKSKEIVSSALILSLVALLMGFSDYYLEHLGKLLLLPAEYIDLPFRQALETILENLLQELLYLLAPVLLVAALVVVLSHVGQYGFLLSLDSVKPDLKKINPVEGAKKIFSIRSLVEFLKSTLKVALLSLLVWLTLQGGLAGLLRSPAGGLDCGAPVSGLMLRQLMLVCAVGFLAIAVADYAFERHQHYKQLRMSKDEVKREYKEMEGSPEIKSKRRQFHQELQSSNLRADVRRSSVIVANPTHVAIGIRYRRGETPLPLVTLKHTDALALRVRRIAEEEGIPVLQRIPLARALLRDGNVDQYIPADLIQATAEVLRWLESQQTDTP